jgi:PEP-CTERM motif
MLKQLTLAVGLVAAMASTGSAGSVVYGEAADLTGSRSSGSGQLVVTGSYKSASVSWDIKDNGGLWHYEYTFTVTTQGKGGGTNIDHLVLELSSNATKDSITNLSGGKLVGVAETALSSKLPDIYGATITPSPSGKTLTISFDSDRSPVWGNFFLTSNSGTGGGNVAYNKGLGISGCNSDNINYFIARPDGAPTPAVPEPSSIALLGCGAAGLIGYGLRRRKAVLA